MKKIAYWSIEHRSMIIGLFITIGIAMSVLASGDLKCKAIALIGTILDIVVYLSLFTLGERYRGDYFKQNN